MARNPNISTSDIFGPRAHEPTVNVSAGEHIAEGLEQLTALGVGLRTEQLENRLSTELLDMQSEVVGAPGEPLKGEEAEEHPALTAEDQATADDFAARMAKLNRAEKQGGQSITALKIRQEDLLRSYMSRYPHLTKNFQQAATGVLGYSPIGARLDAAEAAARAAGQGEEYSWLEKTVINSAIARGVNPALLLTDPEKFWRDANQAMMDFQTFSAESQAIANMKQKVDMAAYTNQPAFHAFVLRQHNSVLTSVIQPVMKEYYATIGVTEGMSLEEKQIILMEAHRSGKFQMLVADLQARRNTHLDNAYAEWIATPEGHITDKATQRVIPNMKKEDFAAAFSGVLAQYDWAIATLGDGGMVPIMEGLNKTLQQWATARLPTGVHVLAAMADMFKGNETLYTMLTSGKIQDNIASLLYADMLQYFGGNGSGLSHQWPRWEPSANGDVAGVPVFNVIPDNLPAGEVHRTPEELVRENRGMTLEQADSQYGKAVTNHGNQILETFERYAQEEKYEQAVVQAKMFSDLIQKYGQAAKRAFAENKVGFSTATNTSILSMVADPRSAMVFRTLARAINQHGTPQGNRDWTNTATFADLQESTMLYANQEWQKVLLSITEQTGTNIAEDQTDLPGATPAEPFEKYLKPVFSTEGRTLQFQFKPDAPEYVQRNSSHLLKRLNSSLTPSRQYTIMTGIMSMTHLMLQVEQGAYERVINQTLLSNTDGGL